MAMGGVIVGEFAGTMVRDEIGISDCRQMPSFRDTL